MLFKQNSYLTFQEAFKHNIKSVLAQPDAVSNSRLGKQSEIIGLSYRVLDPMSFIFDDKSLGRIDYEYANSFYDWVLSGSGEDVTNELKKKYPKVSNFLGRSTTDTTNSFYGPRIVRQLPKVIKELKNNPNSRRAVINILNEDDQVLLDSDERLEYPCADSVTLLIRDGRLYMHLHMRSNNMANVVKLDMYLWGRFQCELAEKLNVGLGFFSSSVASAHVFEKDYEYLKSIGII